jgi:hypothetical protein
MQSTILGIFSCLIWSSAVLVSSLIINAFGTLRAAGLELLIAGFFLFGVALLRGELSSLNPNSAAS